MSETNIPDATPDAPADPVVTPAPKPGALTTDKGALPDWARQQITDANNEAAAFRVQLKEAKESRKALEDKLAAANVEKVSATTLLSTAQLDFERLVTVIKAEVPHQHMFAFAKTLQGNTEEELSTHATELKSMFGAAHAPSPAVDRFQGHGGGGTTKSDPASEFAKFMQAQLSR